MLVVPLAFLAGWLIGNLVERSIQDVAQAGGWRAAFTGELPILTIALVLIALIYVELVEFLEQNRFSANIEPLRQLFSRGQTSGDFVTAIIVLSLLTLAVGVFLTLLAIALVGSTRAANVGSLVVVLLLGLSGMHALSLANFSDSSTVAELIAGEQTSLQARDLVHDLEWLSEWREVDPHILPVRADESLGPIVRWYLRGFKNVQWMRLPKAEALGEVLLTTEDYPAPTGSWIDQRYSIQMDWQPEDLTGEALWKWLVFRNGGSENWQYVKLWAPTPN